jgi:ATP-dependent DNA helicase RecG
MAARSADALTELLSQLKLSSPEELCIHLPIRYEDKTRLTPLSTLREGDHALVEGIITTIDISTQRRRQAYIHIQEGSATLTLRWMHFQQAWLSKLSKGQTLRAYGSIRLGQHGLEIVHPSIHQKKQPLEERLTPIYSTTKGLSNTRLRYWVLKTWQQYRNHWIEPLPATWLNRLNLPPLHEALDRLHQPPPDASLSALEDRTDPAWQRIKLDELIAQHIALKKFASQRQTRFAPVLALPELFAQRLGEQLPFSLTTGQWSVVQALWHKLNQSSPMHCLLQGDVGSGKTIVALYAALSALAAGYPVIFMAPTDILATQIAEKARTWLTPLGIEVILVTGQLKAKAKKEAVLRAQKGEALFWVGTHALFQASMDFPRLAFAIIDEQHRFGVEQRLALRAKGQQTGEQENTPQPHLLMMSATPIPRTLAMSYYADLDIVTLKERPALRQTITTCRIASSRRDEIIEKVRRTAAAQQQVFWVCPLIEASETLDLQAAEETYEELSHLLAPFTVRLLHGKMPAQEKASVMEAMRAGEIAILVATTVIEVGIDIPNATLMVIEHAERFGLAQLHQLRGRVGRGKLAATCILLYSNPLSQAGKARLAALHQHDDGFEIAQYDLKIRGPGELLGARQSGLPMLRYADLIEDEHWMETATKIADHCLIHHPHIVENYLKRWVRWRAMMADA